MNMKNDIVTYFYFEYPTGELKETNDIKVANNNSYYMQKDYLAAIQWVDENSGELKYDSKFIKPPNKLMLSENNFHNHETKNI